MSNDELLARIDEQIEYWINRVNYWEANLASLGIEPDLGTKPALSALKALRAVVAMIFEPDGQLLVSKVLLKQVIEKELG